MITIKKINSTKLINHIYNIFKNMDTFQKIKPINGKNLLKSN